MNRSGNIGAAKTMDSVFDNFTDDELEQDLMFDEDDQLVEIVEGYHDNGETVFEEDEEIFKIADEIMKSDNAGDSPAEVKKDTEAILGPDSKTDKNINGIEDVDKTKLDDSQTIANLNKNGESEADKELGLDKLEDAYHKTATVKESTFEDWIHESPYEYDKENEAEGTDTKFGASVDNSEIEDDLKNKEDEKYQETNDASVKENAGDLGDENKAEGTDTSFGNKELDNTMPTDDSKVDQDKEYNATNDASVKEAVEDGCQCGKDDCPICNPKKEDLAPEGAPTEDKTGNERHEESNNETISTANGDGIEKAGSVDDNSTPKPEDMTPEGSPKADNGDIMDDGAKADSKTEEPVSDNIEKQPEAETPVTDESDKGESKEDADIEKIEESMDKWLHEEDLEDIQNTEKAEEQEIGDPADNQLKDEACGKGSDIPADSATKVEDEACGKGAELANATNDGTVADNECGGTGVPANAPAAMAGVDKTAQVAENAAPETDPDTTTKNESALLDAIKALTEKVASMEAKLNENCGEANGKVEVPCPCAQDHQTEPVANKGDEIEVPETKIDGETPEEASKGLEESAEKRLNEETEIEDAPTQADVKDAANTEVEDTEADIDAAIADDVDSADSEADVDLKYDPSDEELVDIAGGLDEAFDAWLKK